MIREIKFRAWIISKKELVDWNKLNDMMSQEIPIFDQQQQEIELMQYTGLTDKNGKDIYEGDIVIQVGLELEVKWDDFDSGFVFEDWTGSQMIMSPKIALDYEVIGNIYENPELIKV